MPVVNDIVYAFFYFVVDLVIKGRGGAAGKIGGSGDEGFAESFDQVPAEYVVDEADTDRSVGVDQVAGQPDGSFINDGGRRMYGL